MDKTVVIFINYATLGVRSHPSGPKRKYRGCLISSPSASGERAEEPPLPAAGAPSSAGAAGAAGGDAALGATPGLSQSPGRLRAGFLEPGQSPDVPAPIPLASGHSFVHTHTNSQADSFEHIARPPFLLAAASPRNCPPFSSTGCFQGQPDYNPLGRAPNTGRAVFQGWGGGSFTPG